jgi:hypothetical protein
MKKTLLTLALVGLTAASSFGQGKILFGNDSLHLYTIEGINGDPSGPIPVSPLPSGLSLVAALYAGTSAGSMTLQTSFVLSGSDWLSAGRQANKNVILTGVPGGAAASFQIVLVDSAAVRPNTVAGAAANDAAFRALFTGNTYFGTSGLFTAVPGSSLAYPNIATAASSSTWAAGPVSVTPVPEPSSMVLAGLGAASLLLFRRRK